MKHLAAVFLTVLLLSVSVYAAFPDSARVTMTEPFYVDTKLIPAGDYAIRMDVKNGMATILTPMGKVVGVFFVNDIEQKEINESTYLIFVRENDKLVLHRIALTGDAHIHDIVHNQQIIDLK